MSRGPTAIVLGATGLVGRACVERLLADDRGWMVRTIVRRPIPDRAPHPRLDVRIVRVDDPADYAGLLQAEALLCAFGTTIRKAGSREAFRHVDLEIPLAVARAARGRGTAHLLLVSATGADPGSRVFYSRIKGELEEETKSLGYPSLTIVRPSLLLGDRKERRWAEELGALATPLVPRRWKPVRAERVAAALVAAARAPRPGVRVVENAELHDSQRQ